MRSVKVVWELLSSMGGFETNKSSYLVLLDADAGNKKNKHLFEVDLWHKLLFDVKVEIVHDCLYQHYLPFFGDCQLPSNVYRDLAKFENFNWSEERSHESKLVRWE